MNDIRVMQIIDSLAIGGAERVAVNNANTLSEAGYKSHLCATRTDGPLKSFLNDEVGLCILKKKSTLDIKSIKMLISYIKEHEINILHAHSSSFLLAVVAKMFTKVKVVWHDHNGSRMHVTSGFNTAVKYFSYFFDSVICVNSHLKEWAVENLMINKSKIIYLPNYADLKFDKNTVVLPGEKGKRIVVLANLRHPKDHMNIAKAFLLLKKQNLHGWKLLLVGEDREDPYSQMLKKYIKDNALEEDIFILGSRIDTAMILKSCDIGVICSESEGLPMALLEYGLASLAVVSTEVGECSMVLKNGEVGSLVRKKDSKSLFIALEKLMSDSFLLKEKAQKFSKHVDENYSKKAVLDKLLGVYKVL